MLVHLFGQVGCVDDHGEMRTPASVSQRRMLAYLALRSADAVTLDAVCGELQISAGAARTIISRLRRLLGDGAIRTVSHGYQIAVPTDLQRFDALVSRARQADDPSTHRSEALMVSASGLLPEFASEEWARGSVARVTEVQASLAEDQAAGLIDQGRAAEAIGLLHEHLDRHPFRDRACGLLMTALASSGRQVESLRVFDTYRRRLAEETGLEPSVELVEIERRIVADDVTPRRSTTIPTGTITLLLTDIESSTDHWTRDAAAMSTAVARHYQLIDDECGRLGGVRPEQQGEGDSAVVAFTSAAAATRAAVALQRAFAREPWPTSEPIRVRIGVHTGEVSLADGRNYEGLVVITAARLRDLAHGGQIVASETVREMVGDVGLDHVSLVSLGERRLKGVPAGLPVYQVQHPDLTTEFPPLLGSGDQVPNNLPEPLSTFIGREHDVAEILELAQQHRLVTVVGSGGAGKTRLAHRAATELLDSPCDGVWWIELASVTDPNDVARVLADVVAARPGQDETLVDALRRRLERDAAVLVIDNAEHVLATVAALVDVLTTSCPRLRVVVTSRRRLGLPGERAWRLPSLDTDTDAVELFRARAAGLGPADDPTVARLCARLDGVPLAIELAAARTRTLTPEQILAGLDDALPMLSRGSSSSPPRHRTVEASIEWSMSLLTPAERGLLHRLTVLVGSFDVAAVAAICGEPSDSGLSLDVVDLLEDLIDHSLVVPVRAPTERRFTLLETVRQFLDRSDRSGAHELGERHADYFAALAQRVGPTSETADEEHAVRVLDADGDNLRAALTHLLERDRIDQLAATVECLTPYWNAAGATGLAELWITHVLDRLPDDDPRRARLHADRALVRSNTGHYAGALVDADQAVQIGVRHADARAVGRGRWVLADLAVAGDLDAWRVRSDAAVDALTAAGDEYALVYARIWQATPLLSRGFLDEGQAHLDRVRPHVRRLDNPSVRSSFAAWRAWAAFHAGHLDRADDLAVEGLAGPGFRLATQVAFLEALRIECAMLGRDVALDRDDILSRIDAMVRRGEPLAASFYRQWYIGAVIQSDVVAASDVLERWRGDERPILRVVDVVSALASAWIGVARRDGAAIRAHLDRLRTIAHADWPIYRWQLLALEGLSALESGDASGARQLVDEAIDLARRHGLRIALERSLTASGIVAATADRRDDAERLSAELSTLRADIGLAQRFAPLASWFDEVVATR